MDLSQELDISGRQLNITKQTADGQETWPPDYNNGDEDDLLIIVSVAVFGFPALVIVIICLLRFTHDRRERREKSSSTRSRSNNEDNNLLPTRSASAKASTQSHGSSDKLDVPHQICLSSPSAATSIQKSTDTHKMEQINERACNGVTESVHEELGLDCHSSECAERDSMDSTEENEVAINRNAAVGLC